MSYLFWLTNEKMARLQPYFPNNHGKPRVNDRRVLGGIIATNHNGLRWSDVPREYGPRKTLYNRWKRWSEMGVFTRIMTGLVVEETDHKTIKISPRDIAAQCSAGQGTQLISKHTAQLQTCG